MHITLGKALARDRAADPFDVRQLKKALNRLGLYTPNEKTGITGIPDTEMFEALKAFQSSQKIVPTVVIRPDDETMVALNQEISVTPSDSYMWRTVEDGKARASHAAFNRTIRSWIHVPDPGEDYNCRCWAQRLPPDEPDLGGVYPELLLLPPIIGRLVNLALNKKSSNNSGLTDHGAMRLSERNISPEEVKNAVETARIENNVTVKTGKYGTLQDHYEGSNGITVVIEKTGRNAGKVITLWRRK